VEREKSESCCISLMALVVGSYQATLGLLGGKTIPVAMAGRTTLNLNLHRRLNLIKPKKCNDVTFHHRRSCIQRKHIFF